MSADIYSITKRAAEDAAQEVADRLATIYAGVTPEWLTPASAAVYLDCTESMLGDWRTGRCPVPGHAYGPPYSKVGGKSVRYRRRDLDAFMEALRHTPGE